MAVAYTLISLGAIAVNYKAIPNAFTAIFKGAFEPSAVTGGAVGSLTVSFLNGAAKGIFSNEAGLGTSAISHAAAVDADCKTQGLFGVFEVFLDTMFICTLTALTILSSGVNIEYGKAASSELVALALKTVYGEYVYFILIFMMAIFGFSSIIGWSLYGVSFFEYLLGKKATKVFCYVYPVFCFLGALGSSNIAFKLSEFFTGLMLIINLPIILVLYFKEKTGS
jgi:AGCS family alanine or glycine:cation symporter